VTRLGASVTVIIATFNRAALLDECLEHLRFQNFLPGDEVIVVDNGSTDDTRGIVARRQAFFPVPMHLLRETVPGKSRAISRAVTFANGDILAFTDDDVNVSGDWLEVIRGAMADPAVALVGGRVTPRWQAGVPRWIQEARDRHPRLGAPLALLDYGSQDMDLGARTALGANLAVRWEVFTRVGGFPTHLGKLRGTLSPAKTPRSAVWFNRQGSRRSIYREPPWPIGCRFIARASRISCDGSTGRALHTH